jgi:hypothetical protein
MLSPYHIVTEMKTENRSWKVKGKTYSGIIVWPDNLSQAIQLLGQKEVWAAFKLGYLEVCRKQICNLTPRRKNRKIDLSGLTPEEQEMVLELVSDFRAVNQQLQQVEKNDPPEPQPTAPTDSDETPEEAPAPALPHDDSFEADFARYLDAQHSSLPQHTETPSQQPQTTEDPPQSIRKGLLSHLFG